MFWRLVRDLIPSSVFLIWRRTCVQTQINCVLRDFSGHSHASVQVQQGSSLGAPANHRSSTRGDLKCIGGRKVYNYVSPRGNVRNNKAYKGRIFVSSSQIPKATVFTRLHSWIFYTRGYYTDVDKSLIWASGESHPKRSLFWQPSNGSRIPVFLCCPPLPRCTRIATGHFIHSIHTENRYSTHTGKSYDGCHMEHSAFLWVNRLANVLHHLWIQHRRKRSVLNDLLIICQVKYNNIFSAREKYQLGAVSVLPRCQKSDIKETKKGIYIFFCTGESNAGQDYISYFEKVVVLECCITSLLFTYFWWHGGRALWFHLTASGHPSQAPGQGEGACDARLALGSDKALHPLKVTLSLWKLSAGPISCQLLWTCHGLLSTLMMTTARSRPVQHCMWTFSLLFPFFLCLKCPLF